MSNDSSKTTFTDCQSTGGSSHVIPIKKTLCIVQLRQTQNQSRKSVGRDGFEKNITSSQHRAYRKNACRSGLMSYTHPAHMYILLLKFSSRRKGSSQQTICVQSILVGVYSHDCKEHLPSVLVITIALVHGRVQYTLHLPHIRIRVNSMCIHMNYCG